MSNIKVENDDTLRQTVNVGGLPSKTKDVMPFAFKDDVSDASSRTESIKSSSSVKKNKPKFSIKQSAVESQPQSNNFNYSLYADPKKTHVKEEEPSEEEYSDSEESDDSEEEEESDDGQRSIATMESLAREPKKPALTRLQLKIKKKEMLLKLHEAEQNGYVLTGKYNMNSELEEMEAEYELYEKKLEQSTMVDFLQDGLMFIIKGIEVLNGIYNPMSIKLEGLSDQIYDRKEKLDHVFRRLAIKYSGGTEMPPELSLLFIIGGAMVMTHISNSALQGGGIPGLGNILGNSNIMDSISKIMGNINQPPANANANAPVPQNVPSPPSQGTSSQGTMKPPSMDISNLLRSMKDISNVPKPSKPVDERDNLPFKAMNVPSPNPFPKPTRNTDFGKKTNSSSSVNSNVFDSVSTKSSSFIDDDDRFSVTSSISSGDETINISVPSSRRQRKGKSTILI